MSDTKIEWTDTTLNPTTGCDRISAGCDNCYALAMARRLKAMGAAKYQRDGDPKTSGPGFGITEHPDVLTQPFRWRKPRKVFVNSTSDLFHKGVSDDFIARLFAVMAATPQHTYQILTKRHGRMKSLLNRVEFQRQVLAELIDLDLQGLASAGDRQWPLPNVWIGVSVEDQPAADLRIPALLDTPAAVRFLSCEPLIGAVDLSKWLMYECPACCRRNEWTDGRSIATGDPVDEFWCQVCGVESPLTACDPPGINWVIAGGESGPGARRMELDWAQSLVNQCRAADVAVFVKQLGSAHGPSKGGPIDTWPTSLQVREYPTSK